MGQMTLLDVVSAPEDVARAQSHTACIKMELHGWQLRVRKMPPLQLDVRLLCRCDTGVAPENDAQRNHSTDHRKQSQGAPSHLCCPPLLPIFLQADVVSLRSLLLEILLDWV